MLFRLARWADQKFDCVAIWWLKRRGPVLMNLTVRLGEYDYAVSCGGEGKVNAVIEMPNAGKRAYIINAHFQG